MPDAVEFYNNTFHGTADVAGLMQRCIDASPTLVLWILGFELLLHAIVLTFLVTKAGVLIGWMASKGYGLILKGWAWHRQTPRI